MLDCTRALSELALPACGSAVLLARLRYYRAGALAMAGRPADAEREMRLAAAELASPGETAATEYERLQAQHLVEFACTKPCLFVLNAAESAPGVEPIRPVSGTSDALELARQTQGPAIARLMWYHGA